MFDNQCPRRDSATLNAIWTVRRTKDGKTQAGRTAVREPSTGMGYDALVAAHSRALARLSQDIAERIRLLGQRGPVAQDMPHVRGMAAGSMHRYRGANHERHLEETRDTIQRWPF